MISVPQYWSNSGQQCIIGFTDKTISTGPGVSPSLEITTAGNGAGLTLTIAGQGFGNFPRPGTLPSTVDLPYIAIQDDSQHWQAANLLDTDSIALNIASWTDDAIYLHQ